MSGAFSTFRFVADMRDDVILVSGTPTLAELAALASGMPPDAAVIDADAARALGVSLVIGSPIAIQSLRMTAATRRLT